MVKVKAAASDMALNIVATLVPMISLQLVILPLISRSMDADAYGIAVAVIALFGLIPLTLGNVINNVRLLRNQDYADKGVSGDFPILTAVLASIAAVCTGVCSWFSGETSLTELAVISLGSFLMFVREYLVVEYRISINYRAILFANIWQAAGQLLGLAIFFLTGLWSSIYLMAYLVSDVYLLRTTALWKEPFALTAEFRHTLNDTASLGLANSFNKLTNYADRLILIPLAGASAVAVYYVSCLFGNALSLIISPINNVLLSYLAKEKQSTNKGFYLALISGALLCLLGYFLTLLVARPLIVLLYPQFVDAAMEYVPVSTAAAYVMVLSNIANPFVMRFCDLRWQTVLNGVFCAAFFILALSGFSCAGVFGFCCGVLLANATRLVLVVLVYQKRVQKSI